MKILKFKLKDGGSSGLTASTIESKQTDKGTVFDEVERTRKIPIPQILKSSMSDLRYHFLVITGYWNSSWDQHMSSDKSLVEEMDNPDANYLKLCTLFDNTNINQISTKNDSFVLTATIKVFGNKYITTNTPLVTIDDDEELGFYNEVIELIHKCIKNAEYYLTEDRLVIQDPTKYLIDYFEKKDAEQVQRITEQTVEQNEQEVIEILEKRGHMVARQDEVIDGIGAKEDEATEPQEEEPESTLENEEDVTESIVKPEQEEHLEETEEVVPQEIE